MAYDCGYVLRHAVEGKPVVYRGEVLFGNITGEFFMIPVVQKRKDNSPDYEFKMKNRVGDWSIVGNVWVKALKAGGSFFSITIDHPHVTDKPVYLSAFPSDEQPKDAKKGVAENFDLVWSRPRSGGSAMDAPGASSGASASSDDHIPY